MRSRTPRSNYPLATVAGAGSIIVCVSLAGAAYAFYPWAFSPMTNWISDLGNRLWSPMGSILFRLDMVIVGVGLAAFFLGLRALSHDQRIWIKLLIGLGQIGGLVASLAVIMTGIYSEDQTTAHALWASIMFISLAVTVMFIGWALFFHPRVPSLLGAVMIPAQADLHRQLAVHLPVVHEVGRLVPAVGRNVHRQPKPLARMGGGADDADIRGAALLWRLEAGAEPPSIRRLAGPYAAERCLAASAGAPLA